MKISKGEVVVIGIVLIAFVVSIYFYPQMPEQMASHWNARGQVDSYAPKAVCLFLMPCIMAGIAVPFAVLARVKKLKKKIKPFRKYYDGFIICFLLFLLALDYWMILWNLGIQIGLHILLPIATGIMIFYLGLICKHLKPNPIMGIRVPWTLNNEVVWAKTHIVGGRLFMLAGVFTVLGVFFPNYFLHFTLISVLGATVIIVIYSYIVYCQEKQNSDNGLGF